MNCDDSACRKACQTKAYDGCKVECGECMHQPVHFTEAPCNECRILALADNDVYGRRLLKRYVCQWEAKR